MHISTAPFSTKIILAISILSCQFLFAQQDTAKKEFKPLGKIYGYAFGDYYYKTHADSANRGNTQYANMPVNSNAFEFRRIYLGYDYNISERFSTELLLSYEGNTLADNSRTVFIKAANLRWKNIYKNADLIFGQQQTPAYPMLTERIWGYRAIEKTILDMRRGSTSNDLGIGLQAKIGEKGNFGYNVLVGNGSAQRLETDIFKKVYGDVWAKFLNQKLVIDLFGDYERTQLAIGNHRYIANAKLAVIYTTDAFTVGVEAYTELQHNYVGYSDSVGLAVVHYTVDAMVLGISGYVRGNIIKDKLNFFARYDYFNPETDFNPDLTYTNGASPVTETFITAGVDFTPHKNVHIMPNLWYNGHSSRAKNASGHIKSDYDMVPRLTIWYVFR